MRIEIIKRSTLVSNWRVYQISF